MGNVLRVFKRDVLRLLKVPPALVVVLALLVLPSVYTWYNVAGFWNPYDNTGNLRVCVVNEDAGGTSKLTGELRIGDMIVDELHHNTQLNWEFTDYDNAMRELESGQSYAVFVIPKTFTEDLLSLTTGDFKQPELKYYVNEKTGPVAPKITDTGASTLDETINSTFVATVSDVVADAIDKALGESRDAVEVSRSRAVTQLSESEEALGNARTTLGEIGSATDRAMAKVDEAKDTLGLARSEVASASEALKTISDLTARLQSGLTSFSAEAMPAVSQSLLAASEASSKANGAVGSLVGAAGEAQGSIGSAIAQGQAVLDGNKELARYLRTVAGSLPDEDKARLNDLIDEMEQSNADAQATLDGLTKLSQDVDAVSQSASQAADSFNDAVQNAVGAADDYSNSLFGTTIPAVTTSLSQISTTSAALSTAVSNQQLLIDQVSLVLDQLAATLTTAKDALGQTDGIFVDIEQDLEVVRTDVLSLSESDLLTKLFGADGLDATKVADFMGSPTELVTEELYPLNAYGSAMAPLFMNLTFWIGAFMLLVIMKQEVDAEGIRNLTITQRYLGRFLLLAVMAVLQALICCAGVLVMGVQAVNAPALFCAAAVASLAYLSIIYALSVTLQHIGKGICLVLVFAQIPGATGLYPIEMTSEFFQAVYPFFPFTYGIEAMRESIFGFYGSHYAHAITMLVFFLVLFTALGILLRPLMANVNRMVACQVRQSGIFNGEDAEVPLRPYRFSQLFRALSDKEEYREELRVRYERFTRWYPRLIRGSIVLGLAVPIALTVVFALTPTEKVWLLTAWLVWLATIFIFLVVVESLRDSFERQMKLDGMTEEGLLELGSSRNVMGSASDDAAPSSKGGATHE